MEFCKNILNHSSEGIIVFDQELKIKELNNQAANLLGISKDQLIGLYIEDPFWFFIDEEGRFVSTENNPLTITKRQGTMEKALLGFNRIDGDIYWFELKSIPLQDPQDGMIGYVLYISDITNHIRKFDDLKLSRQQLIEAQEVGKIGSWIYDVFEKRITWTPEMFHLFPATPDGQEPTFEYLLATVHPDDQEHYLKTVEKCLVDGEPYSMRFRVMHEEGTRWIEAKGKGKILEGNIVCRLNGTCQDVTKAVELDQTLEDERMKSVQTSRLAALGEMAGGIAHEINNPLAVIKTTISVLKKDIDKNNLSKDFTLECCDIIDQTVLRMSKIIIGLRNLSRGSDNEKFGQTTMQEIFDDVLSISNEKMRNKSISFKMTDPQGLLSSSISCRRVQISQVFINLLGNSVDAIEALEAKWIDVVFNTDQDNLFIHFRDSGNGIPEDIAKKIFDPYFTTKGVGKGTGLGLSLSNKIIRSHGGEIWINTKSETTEFVIKLPLRHNES